ncbi:uncharacterized protein LOC114575475 [Exaiptasia diaphana]|nr:uncharacterized protein LOC114575475 [Exaiptasia diaphana]
MSSDFESSAGSDSSESEAESDTVHEAGIYNPYQFEPRAEDEIADAADNTEQDEDGLSAHTLDQRQEGLVVINSWCKCGKCAVDLLEGAREFRCCQEVKPVLGKLVFDGTADQIRCVCDHPDFAHITYRAVLLLSGPLLRGKDGRPYKMRGKSKTCENE